MDDRAMLVRRKLGGISFLEGGSGEPFLLLHGIPGSAFSWEAVGRRLARHYRVVIPDLLGFGRSDRPGGDFYMEAQATAIRQLLGGLGIERLIVAGHDFGGPVALTLMRRSPELQVRALVLSSTNVFTDTYVPPPLRAAKVPVLGDLVFKMMAGNRLGMRLLYMAATRQKSAATWGEFKRHLTSSGIDLTRRIFQRSLADLRTNYEAIEDMLPGLALPTLVLWGANDPFFAVVVGRRIGRAIPHAVLRVYKRTGHFVPEERPAAVASDIVTFLTRRRESET